MRELIAVEFITEPPATEGKAFSGKSRKIEELAAYGYNRSECLCAFVVSIEISGIFLTVLGCSTPSCKYGSIRSYRSGTECVRSGKFRIYIPAYEYESVTGRICGLGCALSVNNGLSCYFTAAVNIEGNSVVDFFEQTHVSAFKGKCYYITFIGSFKVFFALFVKVKHKARIGKSILTGVKNTLNIKRECVTDVESQCVFIVYIVKVVNSGFRPRGLSRFISLVGWIIRITGHCGNTEYCKQERQDKA